MPEWKKTGKTVGEDGSVTIRYEGGCNPYVIESRKRPIPHANGRGGSWIYTSYYVMNPDTDWEKEFHSLAAAQAAAMKMGAIANG